MDHSCACMSGLAVYRVDITTSTAPAITPHRKDTCDWGAGCLVGLPYHDTAHSLEDTVSGDWKYHCEMQTPSCLRHLPHGIHFLKLETFMVTMLSPFPAMTHLELEFWLTNRTAPVSPNSFLGGSALFHNPLSRLTLPHFQHCRTFVREWPRRSLPFQSRIPGASHPKRCSLP